MKRPGVQCAVIAVIAAVAAMSSAKAAGDVALVERVALMHQLGPAVADSRSQAAAVGRELAHRAVLAAVCSKPVKPTPGLRLAAAGGFEEERP